MLSQMQRPSRCAQIAIIVSGHCSDGAAGDESPACPLHGPMLALRLDDGSLRHCCSFTRQPAACRLRPRLSPHASPNPSGRCRLAEALATPGRLRAFCLDCGRLALGEAELQNSRCAEHRLIRPLPRRRLQAPTGFLPPLTARQSSQYFFSPESLAYLLKLVRRLQCRRLLCVGCPRLHEAVNYAASLSTDGRRRQCRSLLLDVDSRLGEFFPDWLAFNMFNATFLEPDGPAKFRRMLQIKQSTKRLESFPSVCLIIADPPFGGLLTPLVDTLDWLATAATEAGCGEVFRAVAVPHYLGRRWLQPRGLRMHDCQLSYANHARLRSSAGSVVRLFSDVPEARLPPPPGTRWCADCLRHSASWNPHCRACGACVTAHPPARVHCTACDRCVKAKYLETHECRRGIAGANAGANS